MPIDLSRRLLDDGAPRNHDTEARHRAVKGLFTGPQFDAKLARNGTGHALAGAPHISVKSDTTAPAAAERQAKLDAMLPAVRSKSGQLTLMQLTALDMIARASKAADGDPVSVLVGDVARVIKSDHDTATAVIEELVHAGALRRVQGLWGAQRFVPTL